MRNSKQYEESAKRLDHGIVGSPMSPALLGILEILCPGEETEVAVGLPMQDTSLAELREMLPKRADSIEELLNRMARRGTVFVSGQGKERKYRLQLHRSRHQEADRTAHLLSLELRGSGGRRTLPRLRDL